LKIKPLNNLATINKNKKELIYFLKNETKKSISLKSFTGQTFLYDLTFEYDRFIIKQQSEIFRRNGIFEIYGYLTIDEIDSFSSKISCTFRYSDISILAIVVINLIIIGVFLYYIISTFLFENFTIYNVGKSTLPLLSLSLLNSLIWLSFKSDSARISEVFNLISKRINE